MSYISSLKLHNMRCYDGAFLDDLSSGLVVLYGTNGAGKTNVLEAVSLIAPGRGLRGAKTIDVQNKNAPAPWAVSATIETGYAPVQIGTGMDAKTGKATIRINGETARGQNALAEHVACVWLTPQMDRLFLDSGSERRRFLDRLIFAFDPSHTGRLTRYKNALRQRSKLLKDGIEEPAWLTALEATMAETGVSIAAARLHFVERLQNASTLANTPFPPAILRAKGTLEDLLSSAPALEIEDMFKHQLRESRGMDMLTGGAATGPHKSDLSVIYADKDMPAAQCSTGEQKALLIGIILAHARLIMAERGAPPILLLDEVAAHLDEGRRAALYNILLEMGGQVWLTGTDLSLFDAVSERAQFFKVHEAKVEKQR